jgi:hypothetical protein
MTKKQTGRSGVTPPTPQQWKSTMTVRDFGNAANRMYLIQTDRYLTEAMSIAESLPLLNVPSSNITKANVKAVQDVARAWRKVAETIEQRL